MNNIRTENIKRIDIILDISLYLLNFKIEQNTKLNNIYEMTI